MNMDMNTTPRSTKRTGTPYASHLKMLWLLLLAVPFAPAWAQPCGSLANAYGPFDYRKDTSKLAVVEQHHFSSQVETLLRGMTSGSAGGDIDYTLRAFPNHHRALMAVIRLGEKESSPHPRGMRYPVECWLERAVRFAPDDTVSRLIYASYLAKNKRPDDALSQLERAEASAQDNPFSHYNIGLLYWDLKHYDKALTQAHKAMAMGLPKQELADSLRRLGKWQDPQPPTGTVSAPEAAASSIAPPASSPTTSGK